MHSFKSDKGVKEYFHNLPGRVDQQIYTTLQAGRLNTEFVDKQISNYSSDNKTFRQTNKNTPIVYISHKEDDPIFSGLKNAGLNLVKKVLPWNEVRKIRHSDRSDYDILFLGASVHNLDPDGIYHLLGKNGALYSAATHRKSVSELLEVGRSLIGKEEVRRHYEKVSSEVLKEVPIVHLGFRYVRGVFRTDMVKVDELIVGSRGTYDFSSYRKL